MGMTMSPSGRQTTMKPSGNTDLRETDAYKLEVFDPDGLKLGEIPLQQFVDGIFIFGDRLFLLDRMRGASVQEFRNIE